MVIALASLLTLQIAPLSSEPYFESSTTELVSKGYGFTEGPCWIGDRFLFCDVRGNTIYETQPGETKPFRNPSANALGITWDGKDTLFICESGTRSLVELNLKSMIAKPIATRYEEIQLNDTNDVARAKDGTVYFTDPRYFTPAAQTLLGFTGVYELKGAKLVLLSKTIRNPNGIAVSPDQKFVFIGAHGENKLYRFDRKTREVIEWADLAKLAERHQLSGGGRPDGMRFDTKGNLYTTGPSGIWVLAPNGSVTGHLAISGVSNFAFGGKDGKTMLLTKGSEVHQIRTKIAGALPSPSRR